MMHRPTVYFTKQDLELFSAASHDRNPLHLSEEYAHTTPYGEPVVFGILGALAALGHLPYRQSMALASVALEFRNPMTVGVTYRIEVSETSIQQSLVKIYDAERLMMKATFTFLPWQECLQETIVSEYSGRIEAADRTREDFVVGSRVTGMYAPSASDCQKVVERWGGIYKGRDSGPDSCDDVGKLRGGDGTPWETCNLLAVGARFQIR
ncbi:MAG: MaoC/PaaZ C-terminal domain-containing protein [Nitrospirota bacterium]